jgi:hypothetical protein
MPRKDDAEFAKRLSELLRERRFLPRGLLRGGLCLVTDSKTPGIWGGVGERYPMWWLGAVFASVMLPGILAAYFNAHGRPLPGGAFNLLFFATAVLGWPAFTFWTRANRIRHKSRIDASVFVDGLHKLAPRVPDTFALAARHALAAAYSVPEN